jgi:hypothetical protein
MLSQISVELQSSEVSAAALQPVLQMIQDCTLDEYQNHIFPLIRNLYQVPKSVQVSRLFVEHCRLGFGSRLNLQTDRFESSGYGDFAGKH